MLGLTTGIMMFFSALPVSGVAEAAVLPVAAPAVVVAIAAPTTEDIVRAYFADIPALIEVARCESTFAQFGKDGKVLRGRAVASDVGVMQINEFYHGDTADKLGMDLSTIKGNMAYARYLYQRNGLSDWSASKPCWGKAVSKQLAKAN